MHGQRLLTLSGPGSKKSFCAQPKTDDGERKIKWLHPFRVFAQKVVASMSWMPAYAGMMTRLQKRAIPSHSREACSRADGERESREQWSFHMLPVFFEQLPSRQSETRMQLLFAATSSQGDDQGANRSRQDRQWRPFEPAASIDLQTNRNVTRFP